MPCKSSFYNTYTCIRIATNDASIECTNMNISLIITIIIYTFPIFRADVNKSVRKVNDMFMTLAGMVETQHETIVTIDGEAKDAYDKTKAGVGELDKASTYQKSANTNLKWILGCMFVAGLVLFVYLMINKS